MYYIHPKAQTYVCINKLQLTWTNLITMFFVFF